MRGYRPPPRPKPPSADDQALARMTAAVAEAIKGRVKSILAEAPHKATVHGWDPRDLQNLAYDAMFAYDAARRAEEQREKGLPNDRLDDLIFG